MWNELVSLFSNNNHEQPWLLIGNFNNIINLEEKVGGDRSVSEHMANLNNFLNDRNLISIDATGVPFTWCNGHKDSTIIFERLHRAVAHMD